MSEHTLPESEIRWNRAEVNRYLLPVLRHVDSMDDETLSNEEWRQLQDQAEHSLARNARAYAQLCHVFRSSSPQTVDKWFGWIACDGALLRDAFDWIEERLQGEREQSHGASFEKELYFASLFRINQGEGTVDLSEPFEQFYFCDGIIYHDYLFRRIELGDKCKAWIRHYLPYYNRIRAWYRENGGKSSGVGPIYIAYMELLDHFQRLVDREDRLRDERRALEYERDGLGWFNRARKRQLDAQLSELARQELCMKLQDATERYEAYEAQFEKKRQAWQEELACAPLTAFGRKKELKQKLCELDQRLADYRAALGLDELQKAVNRSVR